jgi:peptidyl-prolyl cis-trans isomerase A (cyclophilin A)
MSNRKIGAVLGAAVLTVAIANAADKWRETPGTYAVIQTDLGTIVCKLYAEQTPVTVKNFVDLADGVKSFTDPKTGEKVQRPYYDGVIFHRTIEGFMIQGGDPTGTGRGGPGYVFEDEIRPELTFNRKGLLAMANAGPRTNGSQFFITLAPTPHLNGHHTIFGEVVAGQTVVDAMGRLATAEGDRPLHPPVMKKVRSERVPAK